MNNKNYHKDDRFIDMIATQAIESVRDLSDVERKTMSDFDETHAESIAKKDLIYEVQCMTGVLAGIKPASIIESPVFDQVAPEQLGLAHAIPKNRDNIEDGSLVAVSRSQEAADHLARLFTELWQGPQDYAQNSYDIGRLLGYPKTSTEYFIKRMLSMRSGGETLPSIHPWEYESTGASVGIVLSPDHWQQEMQDYALPVRDSLQSLAPKIYEHLLQAEKVKAKVIRDLGLTSTVLYGYDGVSMKVVK